MMNPESVLIIGANGRTGSQVIQEFDRKDEKHTRPEIYAFCRDDDKLDDDLKRKCRSVITGDARDSDDLKRALRQSNADLVVVCIGSSEQKTDIRTASAQALVQVLQETSFRHVYVVVVSSVGAGNTPIKRGMGVGWLLKLFLRHPLKDHGGQEEAFLSSPLKTRTLIIRPSGLTENEATGRVVEFDSSKTIPPTTKTDRKDLAKWLVQEAVYGEESKSYFGSKPVAVTCV